MCNGGDDRSCDMQQRDDSRRKVRSYIFQLLYAAQAFDYDVSLVEIAAHFNNEYDADIDLEGEVVTTAQAIVEKREELNAFLVPLSANWRLERIGICTLLVLYIALWELLYTDTPSTIAINEAIELAKGFAEQDAYKFVNGILDQAVKKIEDQKSQ